MVMYRSADAAYAPGFVVRASSAPPGAAAATRPCAAGVSFLAYADKDDEGFGRQCTTATALGSDPRDRLLSPRGFPVASSTEEFARRVAPIINAAETFRPGNSDWMIRSRDSHESWLHPVMKTAGPAVAGTSRGQCPMTGARQGGATMMT